MTSLLLRRTHRFYGGSDGSLPAMQETQVQYPCPWCLHLPFLQTLKATQVGVTVEEEDLDFPVAFKTSLGHGTFCAMLSPPSLLHFWWPP